MSRSKVFLTDKGKEPSHRFGGPSTDGTTHCFRCGAIRLPNGKIEINKTPPPYGERAECTDIEVES